MGLFVLGEAEEEVLLVVGVGLHVDLSFAGEPADGGEHLFVLQFGFFFKLFEAEYVGGRKRVPDESGPRADCFYVHSLKILIKS